MKTCPICGMKNAGKNFCGECGTKLPEDCGLTAEVRRVLANVPAEYTNMKSGVWRVTTEGDCEGKTVNDLGVHEGSVIDIARKLSGHCYYALCFKKTTKSEEEKRRPERSEVEISFDINSHTWNLKQAERAALFRELFKANGLDPNMVETGSFYASVKLKFKPKK